MLASMACSVTRELQDLVVGVLYRLFVRSQFPSVENVLCFCANV
jgi:hypothetical protein